MGLRLIQYQRQNYFTAVEECPLLMETNPSHISLFSGGGRKSLSLPLRLMVTTPCCGMQRCSFSGEEWRQCHDLSIQRKPGLCLVSQLQKKMNLKVPNEIGHSHISSGCTHTPSHTGKFLPQAKSQKWLF